MADSKDTLTVLTCRSPGTRAVKEYFVDDNGNVAKRSYKAGLFFSWEEVPVNSLYDLYNVLKHLLNEQNKFYIMGKPKPEVNKTVHRRTHGDDAAFDEESHYHLTVDIDKHDRPKHINPATNPEEAAKWAVQLLPTPFHKADFIFRFSSSQGVPEKRGEPAPLKISTHLLFWLNRKVSHKEIKRYFKANPCPVDHALFSAVQVHYSAAPIFHGMDDPQPMRIGYVKGEVAEVDLPHIPEQENKKSSPRKTISPDVSQDNIEKSFVLIKPYYKEPYRDRLCGALAGTLYRGGWVQERCAEYIQMLAEDNDDEEADARHYGAIRICEAVDNNRPAQGIPTLKDEIGIEPLDEILELLDVGKPDIGRMIDKLSNTSSPVEIEDVIRQLVALPVAHREINLEQIKRKTHQTKGALNAIYRAVLGEEQARNVTDIPVLLMELLLTTHFESGRYLLMADDGNYWRFNGCHWGIVSEKLLKKRLLTLAAEFADERNTVNGMVNAALNLLEGRVYREGDPLRLSGINQPMVINCRNGEVWFDKGGNIVFKPHRPESYLRFALDVDFDPAATCPEFDKRCLEIFSESNDPEGMYRHFMEIAGYICQPWRKLAIIVMLYGGGNNGKTSLMKIVVNLLGLQSVMFDRISDIEKHPFKIGALVGKLMILDDDIDAGTLLPDGFMKKVSEEKPMTGQHKHKDPFGFICRSLIVMLANGFPALKDVSHGIQRRMVIVPFMKRFEKKDAIAGLFDTIWEQEASGILNKVIKGFQDLLRRGGFDKPQDCLEIEQEFLNHANILFTFIEEACIKDANVKQDLTIFHKRLKEYCDFSGVKNPPGRQGLKGRLESMGYETSILNGYRYVNGLYAPGTDDLEKSIKEVLDKDTKIPNMGKLNPM
ncbi:MAG: phage/plasmid primase, P4 family [Alphaproteobacteria bacterium]